ncbi:MAG: pentapeptide repeat-containing protein [Saprospiraceae bacterium]
MKGRRNLVLGMVTGAAIVLLLQFIFTGFTLKNASFLTGFIACLLFVLFTLIPLYFWNPKSFFIAANDQTPTADENNKIVRKSLPYKRLFSLIIFILSGLIVTLFFFQQSVLSANKMHGDQIRLEKESELVEANKQAGFVTLMSNVLNQVDDELKNSPRHILSDETIGRIAALSYEFTTQDSIGGRKLSLARGRLLLMLSKMNIDSGSFRKIISNTHFSGALLKDADVHNTDLRGVDLEGADLTGANLRGAKLDGADLKFAKLWDTDLKNASLVKTDLTRAVLSWSDLDGADLRMANLNEADAISVQLRNADLRGANLRWTILNNSFLNSARLDSTDMLRTELRRAQLTGVNFTGANMTLATLIEANLKGADMTGSDLTSVAVVEQNWLSLLTEWHVTGAEEIQRGYTAIKVKSVKESYYELKKN